MAKIGDGYIPTKTERLESKVAALGQLVEALVELNAYGWENQTEERRKPLNDALKIWEFIKDK